MNKAMSFRDFESALAAFDAFFNWTFKVPAIEKMEVNNFFQINIHCDNGKFYQFTPDTGEIIEKDKNWRR